MLNIVHFFLARLVSSVLEFNSPFNCSDYACKPYEIIDDTCNPLCMNPSCNYDSNDQYTQTWNLRFESSGCYNECIENGCDLETLAVTCDPLCDIPECGFGLGACGYCASGCTTEMLLNNKCDPECNTRACMYDNNACGWCAPNCFIEDLKSKSCLSKCSGPECNYQNLVCEDKFCAPGCSPQMQNDVKCDPACDVQECGFDSWKCACNDECPVEKQNSIDEGCYKECDNLSCLYQNGACGSCNSWCFPEMLGNHICDPDCNNESCNYDYGDCSCSPGCNSIFDPDTMEWTWDEADDGCKAECLVEKCLFNYGICFNTSKIRAAWFQQLYLHDMNHVLDLSVCYAKHDCTEEILFEIDKSEICDEVCKNTDCLECMGVSNSLTYVRNIGAQSLVCLNSTQIYDFCFDSPDCPPGYSFVPDLSSILFNANVCFKDPFKYSPINPYKIYVDQDGDDDNDGSAEFPVRSLSIALQLSTRTHNEINLSPGRHNFTLAKSISPLMGDPTSPLTLSTDLFIQAISIKGSLLGQTVIYLIEDNMRFNTKAFDVSFDSIVFNGTYALSRYCNKRSCMYCANLFIINKVLVDDRGKVLKNSDDYPQNCTQFVDFDFISVIEGSKLLINNVDVVNFQQQLRTFVYSQGSVELNNVNFTNIQNDKFNYFITVACGGDCREATFSYINGKITNFNDGYEFSEFLVLPGFVSIDSIYNVKILNINFNTTMITTGSQVTQINYLISLKDITGTITIQNCEFYDSLVNGILKIDSDSLTYQNLAVDRKLFVTQYSSVHLLMLHNKFININSYQCLICFSMGKVIQNIIISDNQFKNIAVNNKAVIDISSIYQYNSYGETGQWTFLEVDTKLIAGWVEPQQFIMNFTTFEDIFYAQAILYLSNQPNIDISNIAIRNLKEYSLDAINYNIMSILINKKLYIKVPLTSDQLPSTQCNNVIEIAGSHNITISELSVNSVICSGGGSVLSFDTTDSLKISKLKIDDIRGLFTSDLFYSTKATEISIIDFSFTNTIQKAACLMRIADSNYIQLHRFVGDTLFSSYQSCISLEKPIKLDIISFSCTNCGSDFADGGALYIIPNTIDSIVNMIDFKCKLCFTAKGLGGGLNFDSYSIATFHTISLINSRFTNCRAFDGAAVFFSHRLSVKSTEIYNIIIENSQGTVGGALTDYHSQGVININSILFDNNAGYYSAIKTRYLQTGDMLSLNDVRILNPLGLYSLFYFDNVASESAAIFRSVNVVSSTTQLIYGTNIILRLEDISVTSGQGIYISNANFKGLRINFSGLNGYGISASNSTLYCKDCKFENFLSGVLSAENNCSLQLINTVIKNINSPRQAIMLFLSTSSAMSIIENSTFIGGSSPVGAAIELSGSRLTINNCRIENLKSSGITSGISMISSTLYLNNSTMNNHDSVFGGFIYLYASSIAEVYNTSFNNGLANNGGVVYSIISTFNATNCNFTNNKNPMNEGVGGVLYGSTDSNFTLTSCRFIDNFSPFSGSSIDFSGSALVISNTSFNTSKPTGSIISLTGAKSFLMEYSNVTGVNTTGISASFTVNVTLSHSVLKNLKGAFSALSSNSTNSNLYNFTECGFFNNSVLTQGGALNLVGVSLIISNSTFSNNSAENGGAINFECPGSNCTFNLSDSEFKNNKAALEGGAIKWSNKRPIYSNISFLNNSAIYGNDFASFAAVLKHPSTSRSMKSVECVPGQPCKSPIRLEIQDSLGGIMTRDNFSTAVMSISDNNYSISGNSKESSIMGVFTFLDYIISGKPGTQVEVKISTANIDVTIGNQISDLIEYSNSVTVLIKLRECIMGEQESDTACSPCGINSYLFEPSVRCNLCPVGGNCTGGWKIYPLTGNWKPYNMSEIIYACPNPAACLGPANDSDLIGTCEKGYTGNKCFACEDGYSRVGTSKCAKCPEYTSNIVILVFIVIFFSFQGVVLTATTIRAGYSTSSLYSIYIKILTNYLQLIILITQLDLQWPWFVLELFSAQKTITTMSDQLFSLDCFLQSYNDSYDSSFYNKLVVMASLPPVLWIISLFIWIIISYSKNEWRYLKREYFTTMIVLFFLVYPSIVRIMFSVFSCTYISQSGYWMVENLEILCWNSDHLNHEVKVALPSIILWVVGTPTIVLVLLFKNRKRFDDFSIRVIFGFFFNGFKKSTYYWEFVILYRKIFIICVIVFLGQVSKDVQGLSLVIVLLLALYIQNRFQPYSHHQLNHMETEGLLTATITIYCGLYYLSNETGLEVGITLFFIIILGNVYFVLYWLFYMFRTVLDILSLRFMWLKRIMKKYEVFVHAFDEKIVKQGINKIENDVVTFSLFNKQVDSNDIIHLDKVRTFEGLQKRAVASYEEQALIKSDFNQVHPEPIFDEDFEEDFENAAPNASFDED